MLSLINQLCCNRAELSEDSQRILKATERSLDDLHHVLQEVVQTSGHTYVVVDALDECVGRTGTHRHSPFAILTGLCQAGVNKFHLFFTSRDKGDEDPLGAYLKKMIEKKECQEISLSCTEVDRDIRTMVASRVERDLDIRLSEEEKGTVIDSLVAKSQGM